MLNNDLSVKLYTKISEDNKPRKIKMWHASSIAKCPRALYLERLGVKPLNNPTGAKVLRWNTGHKIEESIRPYLKELYPNLISNIRLESKKLDLTGEFDNYDPDSKQIIEIKSVHPYAVQRGELRDKKQYIHHEWQQAAYVLLMGKEMPVEQITYLYITLGGLLVPYTTPVKPEIVKRVSDKLKYLNECLEGSKMPLCMCSEGQEMWKEVNQYCDYQEEDRCCDPSLAKLMETVS